MKEKDKNLTPVDHEPKVIAQIHFNVKDKTELAIEEYTTCLLCGSQLQFVHKTNFEQLAVNEEAHCLSCKIRHKKETHTLQ